MKAQLGHTYRDMVTGREGVATSRHEYLFGCERVTIQWLDKDEVVRDDTFDIGGLTYIGPGPDELMAARAGHRTAGVAPMPAVG